MVDWDWMFLAPLPAIVHHPWFIADIRGWHNDGVKDGDTFTEDRLFLENAIKTKEISQNLPLKISELLTGSEMRLFFQSALHYKDIHFNFVKLHCPRTKANLLAAKAQLAVALDLHPELESLEGSRTVQNLLEALLSLCKAIFAYPRVLLCLSSSRGFGSDYMNEHEDETQYIRVAGYFHDDLGRKFHDFVEMDRDQVNLTNLVVLTIHHQPEDPATFVILGSMVMDLKF